MTPNSCVSIRATTAVSPWGRAESRMAGARRCMGVAYKLLPQRARGTTRRVVEGHGQRGGGRARGGGGGRLTRPPPRGGGGPPGGWGGGTGGDGSLRGQDHSLVPLHHASHGPLPVPGRIYFAFASSAAIRASSL